MSSQERLKNNEMRKVTKLRIELEVAPGAKSGIRCLSLATGPGSGQAIQGFKKKAENLPHSLTLNTRLGIRCGQG